MDPRTRFVPWYGQPERLRNEMLRHRMTHRQRVIGSLDNVRVEPTDGEGVAMFADGTPADVYFCNAVLDVEQTLKFGDGGSLPHESKTVLRNLVFPGPGRFKIPSVVIETNGVTSVEALGELVEDERR